MPEETVASPEDTIIMHHPDLPTSRTSVVRSAYDKVWQDKGWEVLSEDPREYENLLDYREDRTTARTRTTPTPPPAPPTA